MTAGSQKVKLLALQQRCNYVLQSAGQKKNFLTSPEKNLYFLELNQNIYYSQKD